ACFNNTHQGCTGVWISLIHKLILPMCITLGDDFGSQPDEAVGVPERLVALAIPLPHVLPIPLDLALPLLCSPFRARIFDGRRHSWYRTCHECRCQGLSV